MGETHVTAEIWRVGIFENALAMSHGMRKNIVELYFREDCICFNAESGGNAFALLPQGADEMRYHNAKLIGKIEVPVGIVQELKHYVESRVGLLHLVDWFVENVNVKGIKK